MECGQLHFPHSIWIGLVKKCQNEDRAVCHRCSWLYLRCNVPEFSSSDVGKYRRTLLRTSLRHYLRLNGVDAGHGQCGNDKPLFVATQRNLYHLGRLGWLLRSSGSDFRFFAADHGSALPMLCVGAYCKNEVTTTKFTYESMLKCVEVQYDLTAMEFQRWRRQRHFHQHRRNGGFIAESARERIGAANH